MNQSIIIPVSAFILIGGDSKRFGSPKWKTKIGKKRIIDILWEVCSLFRPITIIGKQNESEITYSQIQDKLEIKAPINGLLTALHHAKSDWIFLISCDLPLMTQPIIMDIWNKKREGANIVLPLIEGIPQYTCGFYNLNVLEECEKEIDEGEFSLKNIVDKTNTQLVDSAKHSKYFLNMNTPADLLKAKQMAL